MLILARKVGETIIISPVKDDRSQDIVIQVTQIEGKQAKLGIEAPKSMNIARSELLDDK